MGFKPTGLIWVLGALAACLAIAILALTTGTLRFAAAVPEPTEIVCDPPLCTAVV
jgi:hypothetical protein